jgi:hypothetical protein
MEPTPELIRALWRDKVESARRMTFAQKFWAGAELFDSACEVAKGGIRMQHPDFTEQQVMEELRRRLAIAERWEQREQARERK